ncbi:unnamed protein product [Camellia sinensis]
MVNFFIGFQVPLDLDPFAFVTDGLAFIADQLASHIPVCSLAGSFLQIWNYTFLQGG